MAKEIVIKQSEALRMYRALRTLTVPILQLSSLEETRDSAVELLKVLDIIDGTNHFVIKEH